MSQRLNGKNPLSYLGVNPVTPPGFSTHGDAPTANDFSNFLLGHLWLQRETENVWMLTSKAEGQGTWTPISGSGIQVETLTGNTGGAVPPTANNINVVGDDITIDVVGVPGTSTLTISAIGDGVVSSLTGDTGSVVFPTAGNINVQTNSTSGSSVRFTGFAAPTSRLELRVTDSRVNTLIGLGAGNALGSFTGTDSVGLGSPVLDSLSSGSQNVAIGNGAAGTITTGNRNSAVGWGALGGITTAASDNIALGRSAGGSLVGNRNSNIMIGNPGAVADDNTIRIGAYGAGAAQQNQAYIAAAYSNFGIGNTFVGEQAGNFTLTAVSASGNVGLGANALDELTTGASNIGIGFNVLDNVTSGDLNGAWGFEAGSALTTEDGNLLINHPGIAGKNNFLIVCNGAGTRFLTSDMVDNQFVGINSGNTTLTGVNNSVIGKGSLPSATTISNNTLIGNSIMTTATNAGNGNFAAGGAAYTTGTGDNNCIVGNDALARATTAATNTVLGNAAGYNSGAGTGLTTGSNNILIGYTAGSEYTGNESGNIIIESVGGLSVAGESNKTKIAGIRGATTTNNDAIAVLIDSAGQLGTVSSSLRFKDNVEGMGDESAAIMSLRPVKFNYKESSDLQTGLIAEEVFEVMPRLVVHDKAGQIESVKYHELPALLLNELQKLQKRVAELESRLK